MIPCFVFKVAIIKIIYTTNAVELLNRRRADGERKGSGRSEGRRCVICPFARTQTEDAAVPHAGNGWEAAEEHEFDSRAQCFAYSKADERPNCAVFN